MSKIVLEEQATADTPATNKVSIYPKAGGELYRLNDAGDESQLALSSDSAGSGVNSDITSMTGLDDDGIPVAKVDGAIDTTIATDTIWDAAGDTLVGTGANTAKRLAKGTKHQTRQMNADADDIEWVPGFGEWEDYSDTSTITGWSSYSNKSILVLKQGKIVLVLYSVEGTSNSVTTSLTLPYTAVSVASVAAYFGIYPIIARDNSSVLSAPCRCYIADTTSLLVFNTDIVGTGWTASGTKGVFGGFIYATD